MTRFIPLKAVIFGSALGLTLACGSGGSGGLNGGGPASVNIKMEPNKIDSGDRATVTVELGDVDTDIAIKIQMPAGLRYVTETSFFIVGNRSFDSFPEDDTAAAEAAAAAAAEAEGNTTTTTTASSTHYLVYYADSAIFDDGKGELVFELEGTANIPSGEIAVDIDLDNSSINNNTEFDSTDPKFDAQDKQPIRVGPEPAATATTT